MKGLERLASWFASRREAPAPVELPDHFDQSCGHLALLVRLDESGGRLAPSVQLRGTGMLARPWVRLELVDAEGRLRLAMAKALSGDRCGTEVPLRPFEPPEGATAEEVLGWHWDVVLEDEPGCERARWREHPRAMGRLNAEAELL